MAYAINTFFSKTVCCNYKEIQRQSEDTIYPTTTTILNQSALQRRHARKVCTHTDLEQTEGREDQCLALEENAGQETDACAGQDNLEDVMSFVM